MSYYYYDLTYFFTVMPFGPTNTPPFYTAIMTYFKDKWDKLFIIRIIKI